MNFTGSRRRWPARLAVLLLHAGLFALLWQHRPPRLSESNERRVVTLRLLPPPAARSAEPAPARRAPAPRPLTPERPTAPPAEPGTALPAPTPAPPPEATAAAPPPEPPRTTLRLTLPPGYAASSTAARNPALSDPRSNTPRLTLEDRIADATGGAGAWVEEQTSENRSQSVGALGDRRTVMRRGDTCVEIHRSRIADMDNFNGNVAPRAIAMMGKPYKCK